MPLPTFFIKNHLPANPHNNSHHALVKPCPGSNNILNVSLVLCPFIFDCDNELDLPTSNPRLHVTSSFNKIKQDLR